MKNTASTSLFDTLLATLMSHPRHLMFFVFVILGGLFSVMVALIGMILSFVLRYGSWLWLGVIAALSILLMLSGLWIVGITPIMVHQMNGSLYQTLFYNGMISNMPYLILSAFPYGLFMSVLLAFTLKVVPDLQKELKRVGAGKRLHPSRLLSHRQLQQLLASLEPTSMTGSVLGVNCENGQSVQLEDNDANLHTLAIGTTGSGKTTALANIVESAISRHFPVFYVDGKGDLMLAKSLQQFAQSQHVPFYLFSMVGPSLKYNPIAFGGFTSKKDRIIELRHWSEDHYRKIAEGYLQTVFKLLDKANIPVDLYSLSQYLTPDALYRLARSIQDRDMIRSVESLEDSYKDISSLIHEIKNIAGSEIGTLFDCSEGEVIRLEKLLQSNGVVYFCLQPLAFPAYAETLGKLIINDIKALLAAQLIKRERTKIFAVFDEFSVFAGDPMIHLMNQGRGAGLHAVLATQSLSDIQRKGGDALLGQVLNNTNNYIIQRQNYPEDAEVLANIIGTKETFEVTSQLSSQQVAARVGTVRQTREFIVHPDEIKRLGRGEAIVVNKQTFNVQRVFIRKSRCLEYTDVT